MRKDITPGMIKKAEELDDFTKKRIAALWESEMPLENMGKRLGISYLVVRAYLELSGLWDTENYHGRPLKKNQHNAWLEKVGHHKHSEIYSR